MLFELDGKSIQCLAAHSNSLVITKRAKALFLRNTFDVKRLAVYFDMAV